MKVWSEVTGVEILDFEHTYRVMGVGANDRTKIRAIRERFGVSLSRYTARLYRVIDLDAGLWPHDAELVETLRRERAERRAARTGTTVRQLPAGPGPRQTTLEELKPRRGSAAARAKERGMARAEGAASSAWKQAWDAAIEKLAAAGTPFTSDDVREIAGDPTDHPNAAGSRFLRASKRGLIRRVGYRASTREALHGHPLSLWVGDNAEEGVA